MDSTTLSSFGDLLKTLRKRSKVSQQELAARLGVHRNTIGSWERGDFLPENKTVVLEIARQLGLDAQDTRLLLEASLTALSPYWHLPHQRNPFFTGREDVLQRLHEALHQQQSALLSQSSTLSGLGGIGKTQTAIEYAYQYANDYTAVLWVSAETSESLTSSFLALARALNLPEQHEHEQNKLVSAVMRWLNTHSGWLLIFDNVEDVELVKGFLPSNRRGALLFTSRRQALGLTAQALDLYQMTQEEGMRLLLHRARLLESTATLEQLSSQERAAARELVSLMDGLPLALDQAGAFIEATGCSLTDYLHRFQTSSSRLLDEREVHADHPASVTRTFAMVFERLESNHPSAADLLTACAFLAPEAIPEEFFLDGAAYLGPTLEALASDPLAFQAALKALLSYSLLQRHPTMHTLMIHRLVQVVLRERLSPATQRTWVERIVGAMTHLFPFDEDTQADYWQAGERLLPHALTCLTLIEQWDEDTTRALSLMNHVATYLSKHAQYAQAEQLFERSLSVGEHTLGPLHPLVAEALHGLAESSYEQRKYARAESLFLRAVQIRKQALGADHPTIAISLNKLGILYWQQGQYEQARLQLQQAVQLWEQAFGPDYHQIAISLNNLGILCWQQGQYEQAEPLYQRTVQLWEQALGPDHPQLAHPLVNLGVLYMEQGKYEQAEPLYQRALRIQEQAVGPDHYHLALPLTNLGDLYVKQGKHEQAKPMYERALHILEQALGADHPYVAYPLNGLGNLSLEQKQYEQAESLLQRALGLRQRHLSPQHPDVAETLHDLAHLRQKQQQNAEARALYQQALAIREQALGPDHPKTRETRTAYAQLLRELGSEEEAAAVKAKERKHVTKD